ncbi:MAG: polysulfide reductase NrfD [Deltaproteobacteria bacterium]|nr:polysulfide reductase NrfD [Deltaproteobacteria bacterium]
MTDPEKYARADEDILKAMEKPGRAYLLGLGVTASLAVGGGLLWAYQIRNGLGVAGYTHPVNWAVYITNFVFWVGIAHSGTLISAVLYLFHARYRTSFNRPAEAMTVFALMVAGLFPLIHLGRSWVFYYLIPYPTERQLWVNFRSPLIWDVFAVGTYFTVSAVFFYVGMIPDLAIARRRREGIRKTIYAVLSLGWRGTGRQWRHYNMLYLFLASFATPLVASVHSVVSWDFAMSLLPGWHTTIFAPYFVAGAIFSGTAMVITLVVPMRKTFNLYRYITDDHFESIAKILLLTSLIVSYAYVIEFGLAWYSGNIFETELFRYRALGHYKVFFWIMVACNSIIPLTLFAMRLRRNIPYLLIVSLLVNVGMWLERFVIIVSSLSRDYDPYAWNALIYRPTYVEVGITLGAFGMFFMLYLLFVKTLPLLSISEIKEHL